MKKIKVLLLAVALLLVCTMALSACSLFAPKPNKDLEEAAENLEDEKYMVTYTDDEDELEVNVAEKLYATDGKDNYLSVTIYNDSKSASLAYKEMKMQYDAEIDEIKLEIKNYENMIKKYEDDLDNDDIDDYEDEIKELEKELEEAKDFVFGKSGKMVYAGTKDAIKDSKG